MNNDRFHSPYQFIPATGQIHRRTDPDAAESHPVETTAWEQIAAGDVSTTHEHTCSETFSGRLLCRLTTVTQTLVGAEQKQLQGDEIETIANYRLGDQLAIPGSSIRGVIGSVTEAISQSSMRVLAQREFTVRKAMHQSLKAIGVLRLESGQWRLLPLALTSLVIDDQAGYGKNAAVMEPKWQAVFPPDLPMAECLTARFGDYRAAASRPDSWDCFQARESPHFVYSVQADGHPFGNFKSNDVIPFNPNEAGSCLERNRGIAIRPALTDLTGNLAANAQRGVVFVLGRREQLGDQEPMSRKYYEWFVPYAEDWEERLARHRADRQCMLTIPDGVIADYEFIAAARWREGGYKHPDRDSLPYLPKGYERSRPPRMPRTPEGCLGFLRDGDLVYFDVDDTGSEVTEVSFSSIWRKRVSGNLHDAMSRTAGRDVLPWNPLRDGLTPAERIFGVVEEIGEGEDRPKNSAGQARNLASRVRFSDALAIDNPEPETRIALRQLQSPKPPSAAMYFRAADGSAVRKNAAEKRKQSDPPLDALNLTQHVPNGRKHYLVHDAEKLQAERPWESRKLDEALAAARNAEELSDAYRQFGKLGGRYASPIDAGQAFWFHVDFENLTEDEFGLLRSAVDPRTNSLSQGAAYCHRIGWGKPMGLGVVAVDIDGLFLVNRRQRYTKSGLAEPRCFYRWITTRLAPEQREGLAPRYPELAQTGRMTEDVYLPASSSLIDEHAFEILIKLGQLGVAKGDVCYPYAKKKQQHAYQEQDGFEWFSRNDQQPDHHYQHLRPVQASPEGGVEADESDAGLPWLKP